MSNATKPEVLSAADRRKLNTARLAAIKEGTVIHVKGYDRMQYTLPTSARRLARWRVFEMALLTLCRDFEDRKLDPQDRVRIKQAIDLLDDQLAL